MPITYKTSEIARIIGIQRIAGDAGTNGTDWTGDCKSWEHEEIYRESSSFNHSKEWRLSPRNFIK